MQSLKTRCNILGTSPGGCNAMTSINNYYIAQMNISGSKAEDDNLTIEFCESEFDYDMKRCNVKATAKKELFLAQLSCLYLQGIFPGSDFVNNKSLYIYLCRQTWEGESRWEKIPLSSFDFYPKSTHFSTDSFHIVNIGSNTTANIYPVLFLSDEENKTVWAFQFEPIGNYHIELGYDRKDSSLFLNFECISDRYLQSGVFLKKGQTIETEYVMYGKINGDINDAIAALTVCRRKVFGERKFQRLVYNDYMNALWGNPNKEKLIPLIDKAAIVGAEVFCIDAGWFMPADKGWDQSLGDWNPSKDRFGEEGFQGIIKYIQSKGMLAGCWLEMECVSNNAEIFSKPDDWFLCKYGCRIGGGARFFLNFCNADVRRYIRDKVENLYRMGIRYIKNDYNSCIGSGVDLSDGNSLGIGVNLSQRAFFSFIDELKNEFDGLYIENCGSGAMRSDYATLSHFDLQSITDQEDYILNHCVTVGTLANILPEHMGVWCYPYPLSYENMSSPEIILTDEYKNVMADCRETVFNMVNGMMGSMYLSGRIDLADDQNFSKIVEGVDFYKENQESIYKGIPQILYDFPSMKGNNQFSVILFKHPVKSLLFVFRLGDDPEINIDLSRYFTVVTTGKIYGADDTIKIRQKESEISVRMPKKNCAIVMQLFESNVRSVV